MTLLTRYLIRQNLFLLFATLMMGTGIYLLTDLFERLDNFLQSGIELDEVLLYYAVKTPIIISMILPAVFLITMVVQMNVLERSRELVALNAGGIAPAALVRFVLLYGLLWALAQFIFAQVIGVEGERQAGRIWQEEVRGKVLEDASINGLWFTEGRMIVHIEKAFPVQGRGEGLLAYVLDASGVGIETIVKAERFTVANDDIWLLEDVQQLVPARYETTRMDALNLPMTQDLRTFQVTAGATVKPAQLSLFELSQAIARLERAGSNVEILRTAWHGKLSYACSIIVMGLLALYVTKKTSNIYKAIVFSLIIVFFFYGTNTLCTSMAEKGHLSPPTGAWFANALFSGLASLLLLWPTLRRRLGWSE